MTWNYRLISTTNTEGETLLAIHEVYYDAAEKPRSYTLRPVELSAFDSVENIAHVLDKCQDALSKPVLTANDFEYYFG